MGVGRRRESDAMGVGSRRGRKWRGSEAMGVGSDRGRKWRGSEVMGVGSGEGQKRMHGVGGGGEGYHYCSSLYKLL
jgi:hypothetical protein